LVFTISRVLAKIVEQVHVSMDIMQKYVTQFDDKLAERGSSKWQDRLERKRDLVAVC